MSALLLLGLCFGCNDGTEEAPSPGDCCLLPSYTICNQQKLRADAVVESYEREMARFPSREHLLAADYWRAKECRAFWVSASYARYHYTAMHYAADQARQVSRHLADIKKQVGPETWFNQDWPFVEPVPFHERFGGDAP